MTKVWYRRIEGNPFWYVYTSKSSFYVYQCWTQWGARRKAERLKARLERGEQLERKHYV